MTGVEAVSDGVRAFREPTIQNAQKTLTVIIGLLIVLLAGIAYLVHVYDITATLLGNRTLKKHFISEKRVCQALTLHLVIRVTTKTCD